MPGEAVQAADPLVPQDSTHLSFTKPVTSGSAPDRMASATDCPKKHRTRNASAHCRSKVAPSSGGWLQPTTAPSGLFRKLSCNCHCVLLNDVAPVVGAGEKKKGLFFFFSRASAATTPAVTVFTRAQGSLLFLTPLLFSPHRIRTPVREGFVPLCLYSACCACVCALTFLSCPPICLPCL